MIDQNDRHVIGQIVDSKVKLFQIDMNRSADVASDIMTVWPDIDNLESVVGCGENRFGTDQRDRLLRIGRTAVESKASLGPS